MVTRAGRKWGTWVSANGAIAGGRNNHVGSIEVERRIYSWRFRYAGQCDLLGKVQGKRAIIDWGSSENIYPQMSLQLAAYIAVYEEEYPEERIIRAFCRALGQGKRGA